MSLLHSIAHGPTGEFLIWTVAIAGIAVVGLLVGMTLLRRARLLEDTPTSLVRSAPQGYVELRGHARMMPGPVITAPLSKKHCCWWRFRVEYRDGHNNKSWQVIERGCSDELFHLQDDSGVCVVNPIGARVVPSIKEVWYGPLPRPPWGPKMGKGFMRAMTSKYRYTEERIELEVHLYATGLFRTHRGGEATADPQFQVRELVKEWKRDPRKMKSFDTNGDGQIDGSEWNAAIRLAKAEVQAAVASEMPGEDVFALSEPTDRRPFILSTLPQDRLVSRYRWIGGLLLCTFGIAGITVVWLMTTRTAIH